MDFELDHSFGLSMRDEGSALSRSEQLWAEVAAAAGHSEASVLTGAQVAHLINTRANATLSPADVARRLGDVAESATGVEPGENAARLSDLLTNLNPETLAIALRAEANITQRKRLLQRMSSVVTPAAILAIAKASAYAYERPLSDVLAALLNKLARNATDLKGAEREAADHAFRDLYRDIVESWSAGSLDTTSAGYEQLFAESQPQATVSPAGSVTPEPDRVLDLAFESGAMGPLVWTAVGRIGETQEGVRRILDMIKRAPEGSRAANAVAQQFANAPRLATLLREDPVDFDAVDALIAHMGDSAASALLDGLVEAKSRATRRGLLDRLAKLGPNIGPMVAEKLKSDERWYVQRNMLTLLREAKCSLEQIPLERYTAHADARVRREATQILFNDPMSRDRALVAALRDSDVSMVKIALKAARESMPESIVPILAKRVVEPDFPPEFRTSALHLLTRSNSMLALEALLRFAMGGTTLLGKQKLANKSPEMLIALSGLARTWPNERRASNLLAMARDSKDAETVRAATPGQRVVEEKDEIDDD